MFNPSSERQSSTVYHNGVLVHSTRNIPLETPISLSFNGTSHAVMMATPLDLENFAIGFALTQRILDSIDELESIEIEEVESGFDCRLWIASAKADALATKRRALAGPTGCGICGVESIAEALVPLPTVKLSLRPTPGMIMAAIASLAPAQKLGRETRAVHAAGYWEPEQGLIAVREDVGRHNALDKLAGALAQFNPVTLPARGRGEGGITGCLPDASTLASHEMPDARPPSLALLASRIRESRPGIILLTSRVSVEMVQKTAAIGASVLVAVSAPTSLAISAALEAGVMLIAIARADGFEIFTFPERLQEDAAQSAA
jgi:FdhD protein